MQLCGRINVYKPWNFKTQRDQMFPIPYVDIVDPDKFCAAAQGWSVSTMFVYIKGNIQFERAITNNPFTRLSRQIFEQAQIICIHMYNL